MRLIESYRVDAAAYADWGGVGPIVIACAHPEALFSILRPGVGLAVWGRCASDLHAELGRLPVMPAFDAVADGLPEQVAAALFEQAPCPLPDAIRSEIAMLASLLGVIAFSSRIRGQLRGLPADEDLPFRSPPARLCLSCAYQGAGIEWRPGGDERAVSGRLDRFSVGLMKGDAFPGHVGRAHAARPAPHQPTAPGRLTLELEPV